MTKKEAEQLNQEVLIYLENCCKELELDKKLAKGIVDNYVEIIPESERRDIFFQEKRLSIKMDNIKVHLREFMGGIMEMAVSVSLPETRVELVQLILLVCIFLFKNIKVRLEPEAAIVVYALHEMGGYQREIDEDRIRGKIQEMLCEKKVREFDMEKFEDIVNILLKNRIIDMVDGRIILQEYVLGKI